MNRDGGKTSEIERRFHADRQVGAHPRGPRKWALMALAFLLSGSGCSLLATPEASSQWLLDPSIDQAKAALSANAPWLSLKRPNVSSPYDQDRVWLAEGKELVALRQVRWRADVPVLVADAVRDVLQARGHWRLTDDAPLQVGAAELKLVLPHFRAEAVSGGYRIALDIHWQLRCPDRHTDGPVEPGPIRTGLAHGEALSTSRGALHDGFQQALDQALSVLGESLDARVCGESAS